jgi:hypothetical protein
MTGEILLYSRVMTVQNTIHNLPHLAVSRHHGQGTEDRLTQPRVTLDADALPG